MADELLALDLGRPLPGRHNQTGEAFSRPAPQTKHMTGG